MKNWQDVLIRAIKTFFQGFIGALVVMLEGSDFTNTTVLKSIFIGAVAAGLSAVMNLILQIMKEDDMEWITKR